MTKYTKEQKTTFAVGYFLVLQLLEQCPERLVRLYYSEDALKSDAYRKIERLVPKERRTLSSKAIEKISGKENGYVMAEFLKKEEKLDPEKDHLVLVAPRDKGNLGNAMRSLLAFHLHDIALIRDCCDLFDPKVIRSSMGAFFHLRMKVYDSFEDYRKEFDRPYYPFILQKARPLGEVSFRSPCSLVFGNEASGLPEELHNENAVRIEQSDEVDSLNLTTSIAIALYQLDRQRKY